jgi:hypothetical protein
VFFFIAQASLSTITKYPSNIMEVNIEVKHFQCLQASLAEALVITKMKHRYFEN